MLVAAFLSEGAKRGKEVGVLQTVGPSSLTLAEEPCEDLQTWRLQLRMGTLAGPRLLASSGRLDSSHFPTSPSS